jgi:Stealth protein CR4, conserved region 4
LKILWEEIPAPLHWGVQVHFPELNLSFSLLSSLLSPLSFIFFFLFIFDLQNKVCLNDALDDDQPNTLALNYLNEFFTTLFPNPSQFEKATQ